MKREKGTKTTQQNKGAKTNTIRVPGRVLDLCLRRKRVEGRVYIPEWQSRVELRSDYTFPHYTNTNGRSCTQIKIMKWEGLRPPIWQ